MYSLRDSIIRPDELVARIKELGQTAVAITDHGNSLGGISIYKLCKEAGIKYIHGCEMYICDDTSIKDKDNRYYHLLVLCKNGQGRLNLNELMSLSELPENRYFKPRIDFDMLVKHKEGLIICSACLAGELSRYINKDQYDTAVKIAQKYKDVFGDDYYIEVQAHDEPTQIATNKQLLQIAQQLDIRVVVTTDAHYVHLADRQYQAKHAFGGAYKEDQESYVDCYIQSEDEVRQKLHYFTPDIVDGMITVTHEIADKCNVKMPLSAPIMPKVDIPPQYKSSREWLRALCVEGFRTKLGYTGTPEDKERLKDYFTRCKYELDALDKMGFIDYILLVRSYSNVGERRGIARGSGGGSLVNYLTNITDIDPIVHGLYFERFIDVSALDKLEAGEITAKELKIPDWKAVPCRSNAA